MSDLNDDKEFFENQIARLDKETRKLSEQVKKLEKENRKLNKRIANLRLDFVLMVN